MPPPSAASEQPAVAQSAVAQPAAAQASAPGDDAARWLAGGALILAAVSVVIALLGRRRT